MIQDNILSGSGTADTFIALMDEIEAENAKFSSKRNWSCFGFVIFAVIAFLSAVIVPVAFVMALMALWQLGSAWSASNKIKPTTHFGFLKEILGVLAQDGVKKRPFKVKCDFRTIEMDSKRTHYDSSFWSNVTVSTYVDKWLDLTARLTDGNEVRLGIETTHVVKAKAKRKRTKYRRKYRHKVSLKLDVSPAAFIGVQNGDNLVGTQVGMLTIRSMSAEGHKIRANLITDSTEVGVPSVLKALSAIYTLLIPVKKRRKKAAAAG